MDIHDLRQQVRDRERSLGHKDVTMRRTFNRALRGAGSADCLEPESGPYTDKNPCVSGKKDTMRDNVNVEEYYVSGGRLFQKRNKNDGGDVERGEWPGGASPSPAPRAERAAGAEKVRFMKDHAQNLWGEATKAFHQRGAEFDRVIETDAEFDAIDNSQIQKAYRAVKGLHEGALQPKDACSSIEIKDVCDHDTHGKCEYGGGVLGYGKTCRPRLQPAEGAGFDPEAGDMSPGKPGSKAALGTALGGLAGVVTGNPVVGALGASVGRYFGRRRDRADTRKKLHNVVKFLWLLQNLKTTNNLGTEGLYVKGDPKLNNIFRARIEDIQGILRGTKKAVAVPEGGSREPEMTPDVYRELYQKIEYSRGMA